MMEKRGRGANGEWRIGYGISPYTSLLTACPQAFTMHLQFTENGKQGKGDSQER